MSEKQTNSFSIDTYVSKQETFLLENIRRHLQAETKIVLLESALQDMYKRNEESTKQLETVNLTLEQSINGLTAVTNEKNDLINRVRDLEQSLASTRSELNQALIRGNEVNKLNDRVTTLTTDYSTLKQNYDTILQENSKGSSVQEPISKKRKVKSPESEWIDGQY